MVGRENCFWHSFITFLASHTARVVSVNFNREWRDLQFSVDFERQILLKNFFKESLFSPRVFARNLLKLIPYSHINPEYAIN